MNEQQQQQQQQQQRSIKATFEVWYAINPSFGFGPEPTVPTMSSTHRRLKVGIWPGAEEDVLEDIFRDMQGERWSPNGEARPLIRKLGLRHTSMSVGDVVYSRESGRWWLVDIVGFKRIF